jgi:hypothetical protein
VIDLNNSTGEPQRAHIHTGTCSDLGGIEYPLEDVENGSSETTVHASVSFLLGATDAAFAIDVHKSASILDTYVACGRLNACLLPPAP